MAAVAKPREVEHLVLFKVKPGNEEAAAAMVSALSDLETLPGVKHLHVGPRLQPPTGSEPGGAWTHALYGRYDSKEALSSYSDAPEHVSVVVEKVRPIAEEVLALDWELEEGAPGGPDKDAKIIRAYCFEVSDEEAVEVLGQQLERLRELEGSLGEAVRWISAGKNFAPARAKGHTWGLLAAFSDTEGLEKFSSDSGQNNVVAEGLLGKAKKYAAIDFSAQSKL